jgi:hypothetical protein
LSEFFLFFYSGLVIPRFDLVTTFDKKNPRKRNREKKIRLFIVKNNGKSRRNCKDDGIIVSRTDTVKSSILLKEHMEQSSELSQTRKYSLHSEFDKLATRGELVELHTHLMGMGSADFWVNRIMKVFLPNRVASGFDDVTYTVGNIWTASGLRFPHSVFGEDESWQRAILESKMFDGLETKMSDVFEKRKNNSGGWEWSITNTRLLQILQKSPNEVLLGMVRNWFEFLDVNGKNPSYADILQTCNTFSLYVFVLIVVDRSYQIVEASLLSFILEDLQ